MKASMKAGVRSLFGSMIALSVLGTRIAVAEPFVYVTHSGNGVDGSVTVIDAATNLIVDTIPVRERPQASP